MPVIELDDPRDSAERAVSDLLSVPPAADELGRRFAAHGHELYLVGGSVRDALLGRKPATAHGVAVGGLPPADLDFTTDARPERVLEIVRGWAEATWESGVAFGTVGLVRHGVRYEVTTYRREAYDRSSRNPTVSYGDSLDGDLARRDFTVNAMAVSVPGHRFIDLFGGMADLARGVLRTPGPPAESFDDDPLRILRACRFESMLGLRPAPEVVTAMAERVDRLRIVSPERIRDELRKLIVGADPAAGLARMVETGVAQAVLPEVAALRMEIDEHHQHKDVYAHTLTVLQQAIELEDPAVGPDEVLRWAALLHDVGKPKTRRHVTGGGVSFHHHEVVGRDLARRRLAALRFPKDVSDAVCRLVFLHLRFHGYGQGEWSDAAVRRYVHDAGTELTRLHKLVRSDCTTRNRRKADALARAYDSLEARIVELSAKEEIASIRPELSGDDIMALLGLKPSKLVGAARQHMLDFRFEAGLVGRDAAVAELLRWAGENGVEVPPAAGRRDTPAAEPVDTPVDTPVDGPVDGPVDDVASPSARSAE